MTARPDSLARFPRLPLLLLAVLLFATPAWAQFDTAQVSGAIQDSSGAVLPGVDVVLVAEGTGLERRAVTNEAGLYTFPNVPVGDYRINATLVRLQAGREDRRARECRRQHPRGHPARDRRARRDRAGRRRRRRSSIRGWSAAPWAPNRSPTRRSARAAPRRWRSWCPAPSAATWAACPAAAFTFATGITSINGGRSEEFMTTVDGAPSIRVRANGGFTMGMQNADTVEEVQVLTTNYQAEHGRASAGLLRLVTKSGEPAVPRQRVLDRPGRLAQRQHLDEQPGRHRQVAVQLQSVRLHARRPHLHPRRVQLRQVQAVLLLGRGMGSHPLGGEPARDRAVGRDAQRRLQRAAEPGEPVLPRRPPDSRPAHRPAVHRRRSARLLPGQRHPARSHQPQRPGAAEFVSAAHRRDSSRAPTTGSARRPRSTTRARTASRSTSCRPATIASPSGTRGRRTCGTIPSRPPRFRPSGTIRARRGPRPTRGPCRRHSSTRRRSHGARRSRPGSSASGTVTTALAAPDLVPYPTRSSDRLELSVPLPGHEARSRQAVEPGDSELQHADAQPVSRLLVRLRVPVVRQRDEDHGQSHLQGGRVGGTVRHEGPDSAQRGGGAGDHESERLVPLHRCDARRRQLAWPCRTRCSGCSTTTPSSAPSR